MTERLEPIRVLHVFSGDLWAGAEVMIYTLLRALSTRAGLQVAALALNDGVLTERLRGDGIPTVVVPEASNGLMGICARASAVVREVRPDIIHTHRYKENLVGWAISRTRGRVRLVSTIHGLPEAPRSGFRDQVVSRVRARMDYGLLDRTFSRVIAVSEDVQRQLVHKRLCSAGKVEVIRNGIEVPPAPTGRLAGEIAGPHIGTVGRLVPVKDFDLFLEVAAAIRRRVPSARFTILGDGAMKDALCRRASELGLGEAFAILPPRPDPMPFYWSLDLYLNTSRHEGLPLSILEAMACGVPVVAPRVGGLPEIIRHEGEGVLVDGRDAEGLAAACLRLIEDRRLASTVAAGGRRRVAEAFSGDRMAEQYTCLYQRLLQA